MTESIPIPPERLTPVAREMASTSKSIAGALLFLCGVLTLASLGVLAGDEELEDGPPRDSAETAGHTVGKLIGIALFAGLPGWFGVRSARNGMRATRAAELAASDPSSAWRLSGKYIVAADRNGAPRPDATFKVSGRVRAMLLAVPRAHIHDPG